MSGDQFREGSPSLCIADELGIGQVATADRLKSELKNIGFDMALYEVLYEGIDEDELPEDERCPLPAGGDWFAHAVVVARKPE